MNNLHRIHTQWVHRALYPNHVWSYDFVFDQTEDHRTLKCMTVVDEFTRQGFDIHVGCSITAHDVIRILDKLVQQHGRPVCLRGDNGPELVSKAVQEWLKEKHVDTHYIEPGSPWQNAYCESFNSIFLTTCLNRWWFSSLTEERVVINQWLEEYNTVRPPVIGRHEPGEILAVLERSKFESTTRNPNRMNGPEILGLPRTLT